MIFTRRYSPEDVPSEDSAATEPEAPALGRRGPQYELAVSVPTRIEVAGLRLGGYIASLGCVLLVTRPTWGAWCLLLAVVCWVLSGVRRAYRLAQLRVTLSTDARQAVALSLRSPRLLSDAKLRRAKRALYYWKFDSFVDWATSSPGPYIQVRIGWHDALVYWVVEVYLTIATAGGKTVPGRLRRVVARTGLELWRFWALYEWVSKCLLSLVAALVLLGVVAGPGSSLWPLWPVTVLAMLAALFLPTHMIWRNFRVALHRWSYRVATELIRVSTSKVEENISTFGSVVAGLDLDSAVEALLQEQQDRSNNRVWGSLLNGVFASASVVLALYAWRTQHHEAIDWRSPNTTVKAAALLVAAVFIATSQYAWKRRRRIDENNRRARGLMLDAYDNLPPSMLSFAQALSSQLEAFQEESAFGASFATTISTVVGILAILVALAPTSARTDLVTVVVAIKNALVGP